MVSDVSLPDIYRPDLGTLYFKSVRGTLNDPRIEQAFCLIRQAIKARRIETLVFIRAEINKLLHSARHS
jgi:hypothetical protein